MGFSEMLGPYRGFPKSIYVIFFARIVNSLGNFVMPFLTIFLTDSLGLSKGEAGKFVMAAAVVYVPGSIIGGRLSDKIGRRKVLIIFQTLSALFLIPCAFVGISMIVPWLLIVSGFFGGAAGPSHMAVVTDLTTGENRKAAFSFLYLGNNIGFALGPMIAGFLYRNHLPWIFLGDAFTTMLSLILVALYVKETMPHKNQIEEYKNKHESGEKAEEGGLISAILRRPVLLWFSFIVMIISFVTTQYTFSLPIQVNEIFKINGPKFYGLLMTVNALTVVSLTPIITGMTMKIRPTFSIFLGAIQYAAGYGMIYFIDTMTMLVISTIIWTVGEVLINTNAGVYVANHTPISHRGRFNAVFPIIMGTGYALGPYIMGKYIDIYGIRSIWILTFILSIASAGLMIGLHVFEKYKIAVPEKVQ